MNKNIGQTFLPRIYTCRFLLFFSVMFNGILTEFKYLTWFISENELWCPSKLCIQKQFQC